MCNDTTGILSYCFLLSSSISLAPADILGLTEISLVMLVGSCASCVCAVPGNTYGGNTTGRACVDMLIHQSSMFQGIGPRRCQNDPMHLHPPPLTHLEVQADVTT